MATLSEVEEHRAALEDVLTLATAQLLAEWPALPVDDPLALPRPLADLLAELIEDFSAVSATLAADFYEDLRLAADLTDAYTPELADPPPLGQIEASAKWASSGAWVDEAKALRDSAAFAQRMVADADRRTIDLNVERDPAAPRYARHASANACAFCALNATRGPVFRSEAGAASKYHDHCRCIAVPVWDRSGFEEAPYVADWREAYHAATKELGGATDPKAILAHMRANAGLR